MSTLRRLAVVAALVALAGVADAKGPVTGGTIRVHREKRAPAFQLYLAFANTDREVQLYGYSRPTIGSDYALVDTRGALGQARVEQVTPSFNGCTGIYQVGASYTSGQPARAFNEGLGVAFGPIDRPMPRARLVLKSDVKGNDLPHSSQTLLGAVDLDGDETVDMAAYVYDCDRGPDAQMGGHMQVADLCIETWAREGTAWRMSSQAKVTQCI